MKAYSCGTEAKTVQGKLEGMIIGVWIEFSNVQYKFSYFQSGINYKIWLYEKELEFDKGVKKTIGYKT